MCRNAVSFDSIVQSAVVFQQSAIILANMAAGAEASFGGGSVFRGEGVDRENVVILQEVGAGGGGSLVCLTLYQITQAVTK